MRFQFLRWRSRSIASVVVIALAAICGALLIRFSVAYFFASNAAPFAPFFAAVVVSTILGGYACGLLTLATGIATAWAVFIDPMFGPIIKAPDQASNLVPFAVISVLTIAILDAFRRALEQSETRERRLARAQESGGVGDWEWDLATGEITWSDNLYKLTGRDPASFKPSRDSIVGLVHPDDIERTRETIVNAIDSGNRFKLDIRGLWPDKTVRYFVCRGEVQRDKAGRPRKVSATTIDITERREAELALEKSEERYRTLFNAMSEAYVVHEIVYDDAGNPIDFRALEANPAFETHTGLARNIVVGHLASEFAPNGDPTWLRLFAEVARTGKPNRIERYSARPQRWIDLRAFPLGGPRIGAVFNDVTERKRAEAERENAVARLAAAMQVADIGAFEYDPASSTVVSAGNCDAIFGFTDAQPRRPLTEYLQRIDPGDLPKFTAELARAIAGGDEFGLEHRIVTPAKEIKWIAAKGAMVANSTGELRLVGALFDITARKQNELKSEAMRQQTEILFREMNHRTKNNLTIVASMLRLQAAAYKEDASLQRHLDAARERILTIAELHTSLYQGDILGEIEFADYIRKLCDHIGTALMSSERGIRLNVEAENISLSADVAIPLGLVVNELVTNAVKHAFGDAPTGAAIDVAMARRGNRILLSVSDNGRGMSGHINGTGLGTRIVDAFVKQVGGEIEVSRESGTKFAISVPV